MSSEPSPPKNELMLALLERGTVFLHLDPRRDGVIVPPWLRSQPQLVLQVGYDMPVPVRDLRVDEEGVYATLSFQRSPFTCAVPWDAIFALVSDDGRGMVWPESMPTEIAAEVEREAARQNAARRLESVPEDSNAPDGVVPLPARVRRPIKRNGRAQPGNLRSASPVPQKIGASNARRVPDLISNGGLPASPAKKTAKRGTPQLAPNGKKDSAARSDRLGSPTETASKSKGKSRSGHRELPPYLRIIK